MSAKQACNALKGALKRRAVREAKTFGVYSICQPRSKDWPWTPPFIAGSDDSALDALIELSKVVPEVCRKNVYRVADWCALDGRFKPLARPILVKGKSNENK